MHRSNRLRLGKIYSSTSAYFIFDLLYAFSYYQFIQTFAKLMIFISIHALAGFSIEEIKIFWCDLPVMRTAFDLTFQL